MKKFFGVLLLLPLVLIMMAQMVSAQDTMSVILPSPYTSRVGSSLVYFFEDGNRAPNVFKTWLTITNTSLSTYVAIHYQYYTSTCLEWFDYVDILTPGQTFVIDPFRVTTTPMNRNGVQVRGQATDGRYLMTATAVDPTLDPGNLRAIAFNNLTGQIFMTNINTGSTWGTNAIPRMAVDYYGAPLPFGTCNVNYSKGPLGPFPYAVGRTPLGLGTPVAPVAGSTCVASGGPRIMTYDGGVVPYQGGDQATGASWGYTLTGWINDSDYSVAAYDAGAPTQDAQSSTFLQMFRPTMLYVNHFFDVTTVDPINAGSAFGNRLTAIAFRDDYNTSTTNWYAIRSDSASVTSFVFDNNEVALSVPVRSIACIAEWTISPRTAGGVYTSSTTGQVGSDFLGASLAEHVRLGGWLRMSVTTGLTSNHGNLFGFFSQSLGQYGNGDLLIGVGRARSRSTYTDDRSVINGGQRSTSRDLPSTDTFVDPATNLLTVYTLAANSNTQ